MQQSTFEYFNQMITLTNYFNLEITSNGNLKYDNTKEPVTKTKITLTDFQYTCTTGKRHKHLNWALA